MATFKMDLKSFFVIFIGVIIAVVFLQSIANTAFAQTTAGNVTNNTITAPNNGSSISLTGREVTGTPQAFNATDGAVVPSTNFTLATGLVDGIATVQYTNLDSVWNGVSVNVTYNFNPDGFVSEATTRSVILLIIIFGALAILVFVISILFKFSSLGEMVNKFR